MSITKYIRSQSYRSYINPKLCDAVTSSAHLLLSIEKPLVYCVPLVLSFKECPTTFVRKLPLSKMPLRFIQAAAQFNSLFFCTAEKQFII